MDYLARHYKNLSEQLQSRINHIQQCLYEMDKAAAEPQQVPGGLNTPDFAPNPTSETETLPWWKNNTPDGVAPWKIMPPPADGTIYIYFGRRFRCIPGGWQVWNGSEWEGYWAGGQDLS